MGQDVRGEVDRVVRAVRQRGIDLRLTKDRAVLVVDDRRLEVPWSYRPTTRARRGDAHHGQMLGWERGTLVLTPRVGRTQAELARRQGLWFADGAGRVFVRAPGIVIDIDRAQPAPQTVAGAPSLRAAVNRMSPARSQVVFCLLAWPVLTRASIRELSLASGASVGTVQETMQALAADRYLTLGNEHLIRVAVLLEQWASAFGTGLARRLELGRFTGAPDPAAWARAGHSVFLSGEAAAADLQGGDEARLYVPDLDTSAILASNWHQPKPGDRANIIVRRQFWTAPSTGSTTAPEGGAVLDAPLALVYADLIASGDPRQLQVASGLRQQILDAHHH